MTTIAAPRVAPRLRAIAVALAAASALLVAVGLVFFTLYVTVPVPDSLGWPFTVAFAVGVLTFAAAGAVIAATSPGNRIGWLILIIGVVGSVNFVLERAGAYLEFVRGEPLGSWLLAVTSPLAVANTAVLLLLVPLLFPDGRLPSPRWRPILWLAVSAIVLATLGSLAVEQIILLGLPNAHRIDSVVLRVAFDLGLAMTLAMTVATVASLIDRYRHAGPTTRLQIRWFVYAAALFGSLVIGVVLAVGVTSDPTIIALLSAAHSVFPVTIMIAVLRYRLYDIDVIIRRTLIYAALSAVLLGAYIVGVAVFQTLLAPITSGNGVAVAISTLAVVALFQPMRTRIQATVDRRFYRSHYDAEHTLEAFSVRLRDEVDLDAVRLELLDSVARAIQPASVSLWLRVVAATPSTVQPAHAAVWLRERRR
jgi:hypothetical protein